VGRKALKGEAQERRELKEASTDWGTVDRRKGSQTLGTVLLESMPTLQTSSKGDVKKGSLIFEC